MIQSIHSIQNVGLIDQLYWLQSLPWQFSSSQRLMEAVEPQPGHMVLDTRCTADTQSKFFLWRPLMMPYTRNPCALNTAPAAVFKAAQLSNKEWMNCSSYYVCVGMLRPHSKCVHNTHKKKENTRPVTGSRGWRRRRGEAWVGGLLMSCVHYVKSWKALLAMLSTLPKGELN